jgi:hypothetical protein
LPYLTGWHEKYKDQGLEIIGIHTPEFFFEKKKENVAAAIDQYQIKYPVVLDNDYGTWHAYANQYWPRKYLIDIDGFIVYDHIGEGAYQETEEKIQQLLNERSAVLGLAKPVSSGFISSDNSETVADQNSRSPEIYFGAARNFYLGNGLINKIGPQNFPAPTDILPNTLYLVGQWNIENEFATNQSQNAKIIFRYQGQKVFLVSRANQPTKLKIFLDGELISLAAGSDVLAGEIIIGQDRLYNLVDDQKGFGQHILEIMIDQPGLEVFTFTFG